MNGVMNECVHLCVVNNEVYLYIASAVVNFL